MTPRGTLPEGFALSAAQVIVEVHAEAPEVRLYDKVKAAAEVGPSTIDVPRKGCWRLTLRVGSVASTLTVLAISPSN